MFSFTAVVELLVWMLHFTAVVASSQDDIVVSSTDFLSLDIGLGR